MIKGPENITIIGGGRMGSQIASRLLIGSYPVTVVDTSGQSRESLPDRLVTMGTPRTLVEARLSVVGDLASSRKRGPTLIWSMVPSAPQGTDSPTEKVLAQVRTEIAKPTDITVDGGNTHFRDSIRRAGEFKTPFADIGVSGGIEAGDKGFCLMVGGEQDVYQRLVPVLDLLTPPSGGHEFFPGPGKGHFWKMIHNAIEGGMMQAIAEGLDVASTAGEGTGAMITALSLFQRSSVIQSRLVGWTRDGLAEHGDRMNEFPGAPRVGEMGAWTRDLSAELGVPTPANTAAVDMREAAQVDEGVRLSFAARVVGLQLWQFGGHTEIKDEIHPDK